MPRPTLSSIHEKLENIEGEIKELKVMKVGTEVWVVQHDQLKEEIRSVRKDVEAINGYGRWVVTLIGGTIIVAIVTFMISGGFAR